MYVQNNAPHVNSTNMLSGIGDDGRYPVHGGKKGQVYRVLPAVPPQKGEITALRERSEMSMREFSAILGVSPSSISAWESGKKRPEGLACRFLDMLIRDNSLIDRYVEVAL